MVPSQRQRGSSSSTGSSMLSRSTGTRSDLNSSTRARSRSGDDSSNSYLSYSERSSSFSSVASRTLQSSTARDDSDAAARTARLLSLQNHSSMESSLDSGSRPSSTCHDDADTAAVRRNGLLRHQTNSSMKSSVDSGPAQSSTRRDDSDAAARTDRLLRHQTNSSMESSLSLDSGPAQSSTRHNDSDAVARTDRLLRHQKHYSMGSSLDSSIPGQSITVHDDADAAARTDRLLRLQDRRSMGTSLDSSSGQSRTACDDSEHEAEVRKKSEHVDAGSVLVCNDEEDGAEIFASLHSYEIVSTIRIGSAVEATGKPQEIDGYMMVPIKPSGAVQLAHFDIDEEASRENFRKDASDKSQRLEALQAEVAALKAKAEELAALAVNAEELAALKAKAEELAALKAKEEVLFQAPPAQLPKRLETNKSKWACLLKHLLRVRRVQHRYRFAASYLLDYPEHLRKRVFQTDKLGDHLHPWDLEMVWQPSHLAPNTSRLWRLPVKLDTKAPPEKPELAVPERPPSTIVRVSVSSIAQDEPLEVVYKWGSTVHDLKLRIADTWGVPPECQKLFVNDSPTVIDSETIEDLAFRHGLLLLRKTVAVTLVVFLDVLTKDAVGSGGWHLVSLLEHQLRLLAFDPGAVNDVVHGLCRCMEDEDRGVRENANKLLAELAERGEPEAINAMAAIIQQATLGKQEEALRALQQAGESVDGQEGIGLAAVRRAVQYGRSRHALRGAHSNFRGAPQSGNFKPARGALGTLTEI